MDQCYKACYSSNLQVGQISLSVCLSQAFLAKSNVCEGKARSLPWKGHQKGAPLGSALLATQTLD